ncbi:MAG: helix-turn-helix domain-containing protein [Ruminococcus sp.]|nr:helix-turn-helix domain-containing protein [Ruminococcus sp.]
MLGENILNLRKKAGLSQEQLGEKINVTRKTISNWELNETSPNPEQLKLLSKVLKVSIDELLDNEIEEVLMNKVSNTEKLAGIIIKILKVLGVLFASYLILMVVAIISFGAYTIGKPEVESSATTICTMDNKKYQIQFGTNKYFKCDECSQEMLSEIKKIVDFNNLDKSMNNIEEYFKNNNGTCE